MVGGHVTKDVYDTAMIDGDVFDKIDDLLDFSDEELRTLLEPQCWPFDDGLGLRNTADWGFPLLAHAPSVGTAAAATRSAVAIRRDGSAFPSDDISLSEFEWLSSLDGESLSPTTIQPPKCDDTSAVKNGGGKVELQYGTLSPVSVLEQNGLILGGGNGGGGGGGATAGSFSSSSSSSSPTSSSCCSSVGSGVKLLAPQAKPPESVAVRGRAPRTKRARPPSGPRSNVLVPVVCSAMEGTSGDSSPSTTIPSMTNSAASEPEPPLDVDDDRKKPKMVSSDNFEFPGVRKCMHCEIQKTPQWRAGPMGPKTLCNACGVRYKSGRLFPEYRPAASPTFVASLHSNSHKKVVEMRVRAANTDPPPVASSLPASAKGCELLNYIRSS